MSEEPSEGLDNFLWRISVALELKKKWKAFWKTRKNFTVNFPYFGHQKFDGSEPEKAWIRIQQDAWIWIRT
jgi:hypothetical protein